MAGWLAGWLADWLTRWLASFGPYAFESRAGSSNRPAHAFALPNSMRITLSPPPPLPAPPPPTPTPHRHLFPPWAGFTSTTDIYHVVYYSSFALFPNNRPPMNFDPCYLLANCSVLAFVSLCRVCGNYIEEIYIHRVYRHTYLTFSLRRIFNAQSSWRCEDKIYICSVLYTWH